VFHLRAHSMVTLALAATLALAGCSPGTTMESRRSTARAYVQALMAGDTATLDRLGTNEVAANSEVRASVDSALDGTLQSTRVEAESEGPRGAYLVPVVLEAQNESGAIVYVEVDGRTGRVVGVSFRDAP